MIGHVQELVVGFIAGFGWGGVFGILTGLVVGAAIERGVKPPDDEDDEPPEEDEP